MADILTSYTPKAGDIIIKAGTVSRERVESILAVLPIGTYHRVLSQSERRDNPSLMQRPWSNDYMLQRKQLEVCGGKHVEQFTPASFFAITGSAARTLFNMFLDGGNHTEHEMCEITGQRQALRRARSLRPLLNKFELDIITVKPRMNDGINYAYKIGPFGEAFQRIGSKIIGRDDIM